MAKTMRAHVFVQGRVQGVFFRSETYEHARRHGVNGWVRNLADGRVEAVFEGEEHNVEQVVAWCHDGPTSAYVTGVEVSVEPWTGEFSGFTITG